MRGRVSKPAPARPVPPGWRVRYWHRGNNPMFTETLHGATPRELVQKCLKQFNGNNYIVIQKLWEVRTEKEAAA